jgi:hypothetical protein
LATGNSNKHTKIMALHNWRMKMVYQAIPPPTSSSLGGYFCWSSATWAEVRPLSTSVPVACSTSWTERRKGCLGNSAAIGLAGGVLVVILLLLLLVVVVLLLKGRRGKAFKEEGNA